MTRYPDKNSPRPTVECPIHECAVATDEEGRIVAECPRCLLDAVMGIVKMRNPAPVEDT